MQHDLCNMIYDSSTIPKDLLKSVFVTIPKKPKATNCNEFRTISLMSHVAKLLLRIIMERIKPKIESEISDNQNGFRKGKGTREGIFNMRTIGEKYIEKQKHVYICFIDYEKAFDRVNHSAMIECLRDIGIDGKDLRFIAYMYWNQTASVRTKMGYQMTSKLKEVCAKVAFCHLYCSIFIPILYLEAFNILKE